MQRSARSPVLLGLVLLALTVLHACSQPQETEPPVRTTNRPPSVRIVAGAANTDSSGVDYRVRFRWAGFDDDGVVAGYRWAIDATHDENAWQETDQTSTFLSFQATTPSSDGTFLTDWHTFYVQAIDNEEEFSAPASQTFNARTIAPTSRITFPVVVGEVPNFQRTLTFRWEGEDLDSSGPEKQPMAYEYKLVEIRDPFDPVDPEVIVDWLLRENNLVLDSLHVGPKDAWFRAPAGEQHVRLEDLPVGARLAFGVRAIDEAGAVEPLLSRNRNFIAFRVRATVGQPRVAMRVSSGESHSFPQEGDVWTLEVPSGRELRFEWIADASYYGTLPGPSNFALDIPDVEDDTIRDPLGMGGWIGWDNWSGTVAPIVFSESEAGTHHHFWLKVRDEYNEPESERLCHVLVRVIPFTFQYHALIIDDSRFQATPTDADHDAFLDETLFRRLYDLGGVDRYNTYGGALENAPQPGEFLDLETLGKYRHVVWHSQSNALAQDLPLYTHEVMAGKLSAYSAAGGRLLMIGGRLSSHLVGTRPGGYFLYPKRHPDDTLDPGYDKDTFLWRFMKHHNSIVSIPTRGSRTEREASGMVAARSLHPAYPDLRVDHTKWDPFTTVDNGRRFQGGTADWEGVLGTYQPVEQIAGLDSLYEVVTFDSTVCCGRVESGLAHAIVGQRFESTPADTLAGTQQGRILVLGFQPWWLEPAALTDAGTAAINWLVTGRDR